MPYLLLRCSSLSYPHAATKLPDRAPQCRSLFSLPTSRRSPSMLSAQCDDFEDDIKKENLLSAIGVCMSLGQASPCTSAFVAGQVATFKIYLARPDDPVLNGLSLFGESGSGKSTIISLIERFYDPQAGEILIDGINLKDFQLRWIRGKIGLECQEPVLFASSIWESIAYGKDRATVDEIKVAVELANASKFIKQLPRVLTPWLEIMEFKSLADRNKELQ
ncbi:hypothetical protein ZIOFF_038947 [Zingiber officinale]|uniref:ABC transporter domain-containing protein n=1 Tax=Zingiber officinale TaxID=94328 RepID=A0A8J5G3P0_ZINOF|nr:hypothetical protein ZIOFF_038947 [Zingiber officinale]